MQWPQTLSPLDVPSSAALITERGNTIGEGLTNIAIMALTPHSSSLDEHCCPHVQMGNRPRRDLLKAPWCMGKK